MRPEFYTNQQQRCKAAGWYLRVWQFLGICSLGILFVSGFLLGVVGWWKLMLSAAISFIIARGIISPLIFYFYKKSRPYQAYGFETYYSNFFSRRTDAFNAFPSDHAVSFASVSSVIGLMLPWTLIVLFPLTLLNGIARVVLGYHDEWDVIAGWAIGGIVGWLVVYFVAPALFTK